MGMFENSHQKVIRSGHRTDVWGKDSSGRTTKESHRTYYPDTRMTVDHYGKKVSKGSSGGYTKSFKKG